MRLLLAIKGCARDALNGLHQAQRETWMRDVQGADVRFFVGHGNYPLKPDEVRLVCPDDYLSLPLKTRAILCWSLDQGYDFCFLADTDTYVVPDRLLRSGFERYDIVGLFNGPLGDPNATQGDNGPWHPSGRYYAWISGGNGFWLSRSAAELVLAYDTRGDWAEDRVVGQALGPSIRSGEIRAFSDPRLGFHTDGDEWLTQHTSHYCSAGRQRMMPASWMYQRYRYNRMREVV